MICHTLSTLKKIREKKTISTRHDVEPLRVHIATGGGPLPSSNQSVRPCRPPHLHHQHSTTRSFASSASFSTPSRPTNRTHGRLSVQARSGIVSTRQGGDDATPEAAAVSTTAAASGVASTLTGRWRVRGGLHGKLRVVKGKPSEPADDHEPSGEERGGGEGEKGGFGYLQCLLSCPAGWGRGPPSWRGSGRRRAGPQLRLLPLVPSLVSFLSLRKRLFFRLFRQIHLDRL